MSKKLVFNLNSDYENYRLDKCIAILVGDELSRTRIQSLIQDGKVFLNNKSVKANAIVKENDLIIVEVPDSRPSELVPKNIDFEIIFEDEDYAVINKPSGLIVHPGAGNLDNTLVNGLLFKLKNLSGIGGVDRPGIVHRLDKETSGLMVVAKNDMIHQYLSNLFANRKIYKEYHAIVLGKPQTNNFIIEKNIGRNPNKRHLMMVKNDGKYAKTEVWLEKSWKKDEYDFSLLRIRIHTGRTHQIRVHLLSEGMPIVGDDLYSRKAGRLPVKHLLLASTKIEFLDKNERLKSYCIDLPKRFNKFIYELES